MKLLRSYPTMAYITVLLALIGVGVAQRSIELILVAGTLAAMSWYVTEGPRGRSLPKWVSNMLVIAASLFAVVDVLNHGQGLELFNIVGRFCVWLTIIKLYERKTVRDHGSLLLLSLLQMISGCLTSADLAFGIILVFYAGLGIYTLLLYQLYASLERARAVRRAWGPSVAAQVPVIRPVAGRRLAMNFRFLVMTVAVSGVVLSALVFVIFPRSVGRGMINHLQAPRVERRTGFSPTIDLVGGSRITTSRRSVAFFQMRDDQDQTIVTQEPIYLRGSVLKHYAGGGIWTSSTGNVRRLECNARSFVQFSLFPASEDEAGRITFELTFSDGTDWLFSPSVPVAVLTEDPRAVDYDAATHVIRTTPESSRIYSYSVEVLPDPTEIELAELQVRVAQPWEDASPFPAGRVRGRQVRNLAQQLLDAHDFQKPRYRAAQWAQFNYQAAVIFTDYLRSDEFTYTLDINDVVFSDQQEDPIEHFLLTSKRGHCEYFASALAALCHSVDVEARIVTGYVTADFDENKQQYHIIEANAHAWVEIRNGPYNWQMIDPTPPGELAFTLQEEATFADRLGWFYQDLESAWSHQVVEFDQSSQYRLSSALNLRWKQRLQTAWSRVREWMAAVNRAFYLGPAGYIWMGIVGLALLIAIIALIKLTRRSRAVQRTLQIQHLSGSDYQRMLQQLGFYLDMLIVLQKNGIPKPDWQPPLAHAHLITESYPDAADHIRRITDLFYTGRFGNRRLTSDEIRQAEDLVSGLAHKLQTKV